MKIRYLRFDFDKIFLYNVNGSRVIKREPVRETTKTRMPVSSLTPEIYQVLYSSEQNRYMQKLIVK